MSETTLVVRHAVKHYARWPKRVWALRGLSLRVGTGEIVGLVGPNGAGKTTLLAAAAGLTRLSAGAIRVGGARPGTPAAAGWLGYAPQQPRYPPGFTVRHVLEYVARLHGPAPTRRGLIAYAIEVGALEPVLGRRALQLSRGWSHRLALAVAFMGDRRIVLLDETLESIDPVVKRRLMARLREHRQLGVSVVVATHDLGSLDRLADRVVVVREGRIRLIAEAADVRHARVVDVRLADPQDRVPPLLAHRLPKYQRTSDGFRLLLGRGETLEGVLALCREYRLRIRATEIRSGALEDRVLTALEDPVGDRSVDPLTETGLG